MFKKYLIVIAFIMILPLFAHTDYNPADASYADIHPGSIPTFCGIIQQNNKSYMLFTILGTGYNTIQHYSAQYYEKVKYDLVNKDIPFGNGKPDRMLTLNVYLELDGSPVSDYMYKEVYDGRVLSVVLDPIINRIHYNGVEYYKVLSMFRTEELTL